MLKLENFVPEIYYRYSRDFQLLGRLFDVALNNPKGNADMIYTIPDYQYASSSLITLLVKTLGFQPKHEYDNEQLAAVCSILPELLRYKGTLRAINLLCDTVLRSEGLLTVGGNQMSPENPFEWQIFLPEVIDRALIEDLLDYIMPAGMSYALFTIFSTTTVPLESQFATEDNVTIRKPGQQGDSVEKDILNRSTLCASAEATSDQPTPIITGDLTKSALYKEVLKDTTDTRGD